MDLVTLLLLCGVGAAEGPCATPPGLGDVPAALAGSPAVPAKSTRERRAGVGPASVPSRDLPAIDRWRPLIVEASRRFGVPEHWIREVMRVESGGRTTLNGRPIVSRAGAIGLMQVMPQTYAALRRRHGLGADPQDPRDNILAGTAYLREMWACFGVPGAFAAYHAGPARVADHLASGRPLPAETRRYLARLGVRLDPTAAGPAAPGECAPSREPEPLQASGAPGTDWRRVLVGPDGAWDLFVPLGTARPGPVR